MTIENQFIAIKKDTITATREKNKYIICFLAIQLSSFKKETATSTIYYRITVRLACQATASH